MAEALAIALRQDAPIPLDFRLEVARGETVALVGPSGAGKTTVLRCIAGLHRATEAKVVCNGQVWADTAAGIDLAARDRRVGFVFQSYALFPHMTARQNVMEAMLDIGAQEREAEAQRLLAQMQLEGLEDRRPAQLSGGQQQRVALARALARKPDILLLDEPFSAVDHPTRRQLHRSIEAVRALSDLPIVMVTHDIEDAARIADRLCLVIEGTMVEALDRPAFRSDPDTQLARWMAQ
ncbi:sulfate/molybdate ABC transporter ATP-binding protein [Blastomonas fulva]|uniref:sulfate/molybdate ABC transporter ATP-binding protein n=1 Tax=Blastomonas fulva TaxID=1550728 RepID=UPI0025A32E96|nr:ATP-binding cassette domain-containing protein [Blastomonas fulva]MDM7929184.1 ATP-binding cassette domain-containing protein [Blastomonas fulva]MDM7966707.1 ATP-binding cassette domain-containing protein [Blastomonas fulva]